MRNSLVAILAAVLLVGTASIVHADNSQQEKMKECNAHAGDKKGDERKTFMKGCLSGG